jgi:hypothetical protein
MIMGFGPAEGQIPMIISAPRATCIRDHDFDAPPGNAKVMITNGLGWDLAISPHERRVGQGFTGEWVMHLAGIDGIIRAKAR